jgi:hypothetical protein
MAVRRASVSTQDYRLDTRFAGRKCYLYRDVVCSRMGIVVTTGLVNAMLPVIPVLRSIAPVYISIFIDQVAVRTRAAYTVASRLNVHRRIGRANQPRQGNYKYFIPERAGTFGVSSINAEDRGAQGDRKRDGEGDGKDKNRERSMTAFNGSHSSRVMQNDLRGDIAYIVSNHLPRGEREARVKIDQRPGRKSDKDVVSAPTCRCAGKPGRELRNCYGAGTVNEFDALRPVVRSVAVTVC